MKTSWVKMVGYWSWEIYTSSQKRNYSANLPIFSNRLRIPMRLPGSTQQRGRVLLALNEVQRQKTGIGGLRPRARNGSFVFGSSVGDRLAPVGSEKSRRMGLKVLHGDTL